MAEILPIRPWRYNSELAASIESLISPPFNVASENPRNSLYQNPLNSLHLSVPEPPHGAERAAKLLQEWKSERVLVQDQLPAIYVWYQYFSRAGSSKAYCRKGFICHTRLYDWKENIILHHQNTTPKVASDRVDLLEKTQLQTNPTRGLYTDHDFKLEGFMDEAVTDPIYDTEDYQGARNVLGVIHDAEVIRKFMNVLDGKSIILADGYQLYEASLIHKEKIRASNSLHSGKEGYNFHLIYLTNTEGEDDDFKSVSTMSQKSMYFPKVTSGFLFTSIHESEFATPFYSPF